MEVMSTVPYFRVVYLRPTFFAPVGFTMTTTIKVWIYSGDRYAITNNQHAPNRYSRSYLM